MSDFHHRRTIMASRLAACALALAGLVGPVAAGTLAYEGITLTEVGLTERVVADRQSGVAIAGYDPVAYFAAGRPVVGSAEFQFVWSGVAWRFANAGNLAAFQADPAVYAPSYGGYDADAVRQGIAVAGNPRIFAVAGERLYLFRDPASRAAFLASPDRAAAADAAWPAVESGLMR